jgi:C-terminal domain on Strawberry notch homologue
MPRNQAVSSRKPCGFRALLGITGSSIEYVLDYLAHGFPTQLFEPFTDGDGNLSSRPVFHDGQPVHCRDAVERRDRMIERLASLAPVQGALDQIVQRFGTDLVAEVTGRSRRIVRKQGQAGTDRFAVEAREVRRVKVMGDFRIEVSGFADGMVDRLKAMGLVSEIIAWKLRLFVPVGADGPTILGALMERYPLVRIAERPAA